MKKYLLSTLLMFDMSTYSARAGVITSFMIGASTGLVSACGVFKPTLRNIVKNNYLKKTFVTAMITAGIMLSPVMASWITEKINGREYPAIAAVADMSVGIGSAIYFRLGSTAPFNLSEDVLWPAAVFSVLKVPALFLLFS